MALAQEPTPINTTEYWKERALKAEKRAEAAEELQRRIMADLSNKKVRPSARIAGVFAWFGALREQESRVHEAKQNDDPVDLYTLPVPTQKNLAKASGLSTATIGRALNDLNDAGALHKSVVRTKDEETGRWNTQSYFHHPGGPAGEKGDALDALATADLTTLPNYKQHGGYHPKLVDRVCQSCGSDNTKLKCQNCGKTKHTARLKEYPLTVLQVETEVTESDDTNAPEIQLAARSESENLPLIPESDGIEGDDTNAPEIQLASTRVRTIPTPLCTTSFVPSTCKSGVSSSFDPDDTGDAPPDLLWDDQEWSVQ